MCRRANKLIFHIRVKGRAEERGLFLLHGRWLDEAIRIYVFTYIV
jgi:hypothetical protein